MKQADIEMVESVIITAYQEFQLELEEEGIRVSYNVSFEAFMEWLKKKNDVKL